MCPKIIEPLAFWFLVLYQFAKIVVHFLQHFKYTTELICAILGVVILRKVGFQDSSFTLDEWEVNCTTSGKYTPIEIVLFHGLYSIVLN